MARFDVLGTAELKQPQEGVSLQGWVLHEKSDVRFEPCSFWKWPSPVSKPRQMADAAPVAEPRSRRAAALPKAEPPPLKRVRADQGKKHAAVKQPKLPAGVSSPAPPATGPRGGSRRFQTKSTPLSAEPDAESNPRRRRPESPPARRAAAEKAAAEMVVVVLS